ncbi:MAG TPA: hypothetical protein P5571_06780 [Candidatus Krumholzibacteria bacterium]|nr:hypothetical protein [Candidatus Krumholzibacteria bacterium]HRX51048.1 hypothetical protein [Candidatus Krumholzibacteria bacterium]
MHMRHRGLGILLGLLLLSGAALASTSTYPLPGLLGSYSAEPGLHLRSDGFTLPSDLGTVSEVFIACSGVYLPGETRDDHDQTYVWEAELTLFLQVGEDLFWAVLSPAEGAFNLQAMFVSPGGSPVTSGSIVGGAEVIVDAVLLATGDDGRTVVRYPAVSLTAASLEVHASVPNQDTSMSRLKALYR